MGRNSVKMFLWEVNVNLGALSSSAGTLLMARRTWSVASGRGGYMLVLLLSCQVAIMSWDFARNQPGLPRSQQATQKSSILGLQLVAMGLHPEHAQCGLGLSFYSPQLNHKVLLCIRASLGTGCIGCFHYFPVMKIKLWACSKVNGAQGTSATSKPLEL